MADISGCFDARENTPKNMAKWTSAMRQQAQQNATSYSMNNDSWMKLLQHSGSI